MKIKKMLKIKRFGAVAWLKISLALLLLSFTGFYVAGHKTPDNQAVAVSTQTGSDSSSVSTDSSQSTETVPQTTPEKTVETPPAAQPAPAPKPATKAPAPTPAPVVTPAPQSSVDTLEPVPTNTTTNLEYTSTNWAGWMATTGTYTKVSGSWVTPQISGGNGTSTSADAAWIGIGGVSSNDLIQVGTMNIVSASGQLTTVCFYELLPAAAQNIVAVSVSPGDSMSASITETSVGQWQIYIINNTTGQSYTKSVSYASSYSSAEWIEEDPSNSSGALVPLANFTTVAFTNGMATSNGVNQNILANQAVRITLVNSSAQPLATTSALGSGGSSFSVTRN